MSGAIEIKQLAGNPLLDTWFCLKPEADRTLASWTDFNCTWEDVYKACDLLGLSEEEREEIKVLQQHMLEHPYPRAGRWLEKDGSDIAIHSLRRAATQKYSWAIPSPSILKAIARLSPIVEIGAGTGYWASLLTEAGADVVAYDEHLPGPENHWHQDPVMYFPVQVGGPESAAKHPDRTLLLCWPPYRPEKRMMISQPEDPHNWEMEHTELPDHPNGGYTTWRKKNEEPDVAYESLMHYEMAGGQKLVYIGEGSGGCTAGPFFHARIGQGCDHWSGEKPCECPEPGWTTMRKDAHVPQWHGIHDYASFYRRIETEPSS